MFDAVKHLIFSLLFIALSFPVFGQEKPAADESPETEALVKKLEETPDDASAYYNLGTAFLLQNELGPARYHLEKARLLDPNAEDVLNNIELIRQRLALLSSGSTSFFLYEAWEKLISLFSPSGWSYWVLFFLAIAALTSYLHSLRRLGNRKIFRLGFTSTLLLALFCTLLMYKRYMFLHNPGKAVVYTSVSLTDQAGAAGKEKRILVPGHLITILEKHQDWVRVRTEALEEGWLPTENIKEL